MSSNSRRQSYNGSQQRTTPSGGQYGYGVQQGDHSPESSQGSFPQEGMYEYQNLQPDPFGAFPLGQTYPQVPYLGHAQHESTQQHLGNYSPSSIPYQYTANPNAPEWNYGAGPSQGVPQNVIYNPQDGSYRPFTPQPHLPQQWVDVEVSRSLTPQPGVPGHPSHNPQFVTAGGKILSASSARQCPNCAASFERNTDLNRHIRTNHTGVAPYKCNGCGSSYSRSDGRGKHWKENPACKLRHDEESNA